MRLSFAEVVIDTERFELSVHGEPVHVEPKVFSLLTYLAENAERVVSHDELIHSVWQGRVVSETTVASCIKHARKAIGDSGEKQSFIKTVRGRGFRLCAVVSQQISSSDSSVKCSVEHMAENTTENLADVSAAVVSSRKPTDKLEHLATGATNTAVRSRLMHELPGATLAVATEGFNPALVIQQFQSFSDSPSMASFVQNLSISLTTALTRIPLLRLAAIPANMKSTPRDIHEQFGADYLLTGSAESIEEQIRLMVQLSDAKTGFNLWSHQFVIPGTEQTALNGSVLTIMAKLEPQLHRAMYESVRSQGNRPNALELYLQASGLLAMQGWRHESFNTASVLLRESWRQAPEFAHASSYLSLVLGLGVRLGLMPGEGGVRDEALEAAESSIKHENMDSAVLGFAGCALGDLGHTTRALSIIRQAVELNPANGQAWAALGSVSLTARRVDEAIAHLRQGIAISPLDSRLSVWGGVLATALRVSGDLPEAMQQAELACQRDDRAYMPRVVLAGIYSAASDDTKAREALTDAYRIKSDLTHQQIGYLVGKRLASNLISNTSRR